MLPFASPNYLRYHVCWRGPRYDIEWVMSSHLSAKNGPDVRLAMYVAAREFAFVMGNVCSLSYSIQDLK